MEPIFIISAVLAAISVVGIAVTLFLISIGKIKS